MRFFRANVKPDADGFFTAGSADSILPDQMKSVKINGRTVVFVRWKGKIYAFDNTCPHAAADLSQGMLSRYKVTCPEHNYCFDLRSGRILWPEDELYRLKSYPVKEEDGIVKVKLS